MPASTIMFIRHAEKPGENWPGPGLTAEGLVDKKSLVIRGWQRAGAWAALFFNPKNSADYPQPAKIYAAKPESAYDGVDPSQRPFETVIPIAQRLGIAPVKDFSKGQEKELATELNGQSGTILVCWEHKALVEDLVPDFLGPQQIGPQQIKNLPSKWDGDRFDVVLRFDRADPGGYWTFRQLFPQLLSGDSNNPLL